MVERDSKREFIYRSQRSSLKKKSRGRSPERLRKFFEKQMHMECLVKWIKTANKITANQLNAFGLQPKLEGPTAQRGE